VPGLTAAEQIHQIAQEALKEFAAFLELGLGHACERTTCEMTSSLS
jgi:hypothetical protein